MFTIGHRGKQFKQRANGFMSPEEAGYRERKKVAKNKGAKKKKSVTKPDGEALYMYDLTTKTHSYSNWIHQSVQGEYLVYFCDYINGKWVLPRPVEHGFATGVTVFDKDRFERCATKVRARPSTLSAC